jgi:tetratricopeptide (TPR) repeat protein
VPILLSALFGGGKGPGGDDLKAVLSGRDDTDFGRALARDGYTDLAERVCLAIQKNYASDTAKVLECEALLGEIHRDQAYRETDPTKRRQKLEAVLLEKTNFISSHGDTPAAEDAAQSLPDLYRVIGDTLLGLVDTAADDNAKGELRREASRIFEEAEGFVGKRVGTLRKGWEEAQKAAQAAIGTPNEKETQAASDQAGSKYLVAAAGLARTRYYHATTLDSADPARLKLLQTVASAYDDLELDFPDALAIFDGFIFRGLANDGMGNTDAAIKSFDAAIRVRDFFEPASPKSNVHPVPEEVADVISNAVHQKMLLYVKKGQNDEAIKTANDFFATVQDARKASRALAILATLADAYDADGNIKARDATANQLIDLDPLGPGGRKGRQLLGGGGGGATKLGPRNLLVLANTQAGSGESDKAMETCRQVLALARGSKDEQNLGSDACVLLGALYSQKELYEEAVTAWDAAIERYPDGTSTADALWRSINGYIKLGVKQKRAIWDKRYRERVTQLSTKFPNNPNTARVALLEGQRREDEGDYNGAAQIYEKIQKGSAAFEEAEFRSGAAYAKHAHKLFSDGKAAEAKVAYAKAEQVLRKTTADVKEALKKTLEPDVQARLAGIDFSARVALSGVLLSEAVNKPAEVPALLEDAEKICGGDANKLGNIWDLRFKSYQAQGKLDEALAQLEAALKDPKSAAGLDRVAVNAGRAFDQRAIETLQKQPESSEIDVLFKKSLDWYLRGLAPQLEGRSAVEVGTMEGVATRLFIFGLHMNKVPPDVQSFADWTGKVIAPDPWNQAIRLYTVVLPYTNNSRTLLETGRVQAWLSKWKEASSTYAKYFDREKFYDPAKKEVDKTRLKDSPELLYNLLEWGIVEHHAAAGDASDKTHGDRAKDIYRTISNTVPKDSKTWWQSKYLWLRLAYEQGLYTDADVVLRSIENTSNKEDAKSGYKSAFDQLRKDIDEKLVKSPK